MRSTSRRVYVYKMHPFPPRDVPVTPPVPSQAWTWAMRRTHDAEVHDTTYTLEYT
jgi:hypothetical protein